MKSNDRIIHDWLEQAVHNDPETLSDIRSAVVQEHTDKRRAIKVPLREEGTERSVTYETIVRTGRPVLHVSDHAIVFDGNGYREHTTVINRLRSSRRMVEAALPFVGRIDVANHSAPLSFIGTGWLVRPALVVTNRHVAELIAREEAGQFVFRRGRYGDDLKVSLDNRHEFENDVREPRRVDRVLWMERDPKRADIAFLELAEAPDAPTGFVQISAEDAAPGTDVAVVGYPARGTPDDIPDQAWMDDLYGATYDVKRVAPGKMTAPTTSWCTHDCTTLGGNSGSVVLSLDTGKAVGLHFAGKFAIENYAVPARSIAAYLRDRPWHPHSVSPPPPSSPTTTQRAMSSSSDSRFALGASREVQITVPITITIEVGDPVQVTEVPSASETPSVQELAREFEVAHRGDGILSVRPGHVVIDDAMADEPCLVVSAHPDRLAAVQARMPDAYRGIRVQVREASLLDISGGDALTLEAVESILYDDENRTGEGFSFDWVAEEMRLILHLGPERSWVQLQPFLEGATEELVSSIYQFHAAHVADVIEDRLDDEVKMTLVMSTQSRDPKDDDIEAGNFDRSDTFAEWATKHGDRFERVHVPQGSTGLVAYSYHTKVTVRDRSAVWLSSGNWKKSSQPVIPDAQLNNPSATWQAGNREWHVILHNDTLAERFRNHILADYQRSLELGGTPEARTERTLVDVPESLLNLDAPPVDRVIEPLEINRRVRVKPLLTPDLKGAIYCEAVLDLIRSARRQLVFQIPYISMAKAEDGFPGQLMDALVKQAQDLEDFRLILRPPYGRDGYGDISRLRYRGIDAKQIRLQDNLHAKGMIVDGERVLVGSHNWSRTGVTLNRDASLIFDDEEIARYFLEAFDLDWERGRPISRSPRRRLETPRLAEGTNPPPGFHRMALADFLEG